MVDPNEQLPLATPVGSKRKISGIGRGGKASWITWKNGLLAFAWLVFAAAIGFLTFPAKTWVKAVVFAAIAIPGLCFFLIPIPGKDYYWVYNYVFNSIKFWFARSANTMPNLAATADFIPYDSIKGNKLFMKGDSSVQIFWRLNGKNIYSASSEIQQSLLNGYHTMFKDLRNSTIKIVGFKCNFNLKNNIDYWNSIINEDRSELINTAFVPISVLEWQNFQFKHNFPFYLDDREQLNAEPQPRDMVYLLVISADSESTAEVISKMVLPPLSAVDGNFVEPATVDDIKMYIRKQLGLTSVDNINGWTVTKNADGEEIHRINLAYSNMHKMVFKSKYWHTVDHKQVNKLPKDHYHKILSLSTFKTDATLGWMDTFFENPSVDCVQIKFQEMNLDKQTKLIGKAINQYTKVEKGTKGLGSFGQAKLSQTFEFLKDIEEKTGHADVNLITTTFYIKISADSLEKLNRKELELKAAFKRSLGLGKKCYEYFWFNQRDALLSSLGILRDKLAKKIGTNLLSAAVALGWPFNNPRIIQPSGFNIGFTDNGMCPVCLDLAGERSLSGMIVGKTGSGKSMLAKLLSMDILLNLRNKLFWFDPENEMANFGYNLNAIHIDLTSQEPVINKITFKYLHDKYLSHHLNTTEPRFLWAYMTLLKLPKSYLYMHGLPNKEIERLMKENRDVELNERVKFIPLIQEEMDYFGLGSFEQHSRVVSITNPQITPEMVEAQVKYFKNKLLEETQLEQLYDIIEVYKFIYNECVIRSNINPYRIVLSSDDSYNDLNGFKLFQQHKQMLMTWFKQLCPKADVIATTWFNDTLDKLYYNWYNIVTTTREGQQIINYSAQELVNFKKPYPTINDHYDLMIKEFTALKNEKHPKDQQKDIDERIKIYDSILSVFDNLVLRNRDGKRGIFYYLWNTDNKMSFTNDNRLIIFNIQNLLTNVRNIKENNYSDKIRIDFQNIFNAQYFLSQQIIWSFVVNNRIQNHNPERPKSEQTRVYVFMDEAHASLKQPQFVDWSVNFIKRARKYESGLWLITQSIGDYLNLDGASELFNSFMFKFYFQCEAQAFDDVLKKFEISKVPLTVQEERWLNPLMGNTVQGRCILTFEDGKRYMMTATLSTTYVKPLLEQPIISSKPYVVNEQDYGVGIVGLLNYLRSDPAALHKAGMDDILYRSYETWKLNNLKKYDYDKWAKLDVDRRLRNKEILEVKLQKAKADVQASIEENKKEKRK